MLGEINNGGSGNDFVFSPGTIAQTPNKLCFIVFWFSDTIVLL